MKIRIIDIGIVFCACILFNIPISASAGPRAAAQCISTAKSIAKSCIKECNDERVSAVLSCLVPANSCGDACKAAYGACMDPILEAQKACLADSDAKFQADRVECASQAKCELNRNCHLNAAFGYCIDSKAIARAVRRVECHRDGARRAAKQACHKSLRACSRVCKASK